MLVVVCAAVYESVLLTDCYVLPWCLVPLGAVCVNRVFSNTLSASVNDSVNECFHDLCTSYGSRCFFLKLTFVSSVYLLLCGCAGTPLQAWRDSV